MQKINSLKDRLEEIEHDLTSNIENLTTKKERNMLLKKVDDDIEEATKTLRQLETKNKKEKKKNIQKNANKKITGKKMFNCKTAITNLKTSKYGIQIK